MFAIEILNKYFAQVRTTYYNFYIHILIYICIYIIIVLASQIKQIFSSEVLRLRIRIWMYTAIFLYIFVCFPENWLFGIYLQNIVFSTLPQVFKVLF